MDITAVVGAAVDSATPLERTTLVEYLRTRLGADAPAVLETSPTEYCATIADLPEADQIRHLRMLANRSTGAVFSARADELTASLAKRTSHAETAAMLGVTMETTAHAAARHNRRVAARGEE